MSIPSDIHIYTDGASRGNPGHASTAVLICDAADQPIASETLGFANPTSEYIGTKTNNIAEYRAVIKALDLIDPLSICTIDFFSDSELMVKQLNGVYKIQSLPLLELHSEIKARLPRYKKISFTHVRRSHPQIAICDAMANKALDEELQIARTPALPQPSGTLPATCPACQHRLAVPIAALTSGLSCPLCKKHLDVGNIEELREQIRLLVDGYNQTLSHIGSHLQLRPTAQ